MTSKRCIKNRIDFSCMHVVIIVLLTSFNVVWNVGPDPNRIVMALMDSLNLDLYADYDVVRSPCIGD